MSMKNTRLNWRNWNYYKSFSVITVIPFSLSNLVQIPSPSMSVSENVPSKTFPQPQEGDLDLKITSVHHISWIMSNTFWAPFWYWSVTSSPAIVFTVPSFCISACSLGVFNHQSSSGHKGIASHSSTSWITFWQGFAFPLNLQGIPARQALTIFITIHKKLNSSFQRKFTTQNL